VIAAVMHIVYPSFIAYSHYLWPESTYIFFLILALLCADSACRRDPPRQKIVYGASAGLLIAVCFLTKASGIFLMPVIPAWLVMVGRGRRPYVQAAAAFVLAWVIPWGTWSAVTSRAQGHFVPSSAGSGNALYTGNNPWIPPGIGTLATPEIAAKMRQPVRLTVATEGLDPDRAARALALREIGDHPGRFLTRVAYRFGEYWFCDSVAIAYLFRAYYPPMRPWVAGLLCSLVAMSFFSLVALIARGLLSEGDIPSSSKLLLLGMGFMLMLPSLLVVGQSRYHIPTLAIMLPAAGVAVVRIKRRLAYWQEATWAVGCVGFLILSVAGLPKLVNHHVRASCYYGSFVRFLGDAFGFDSYCASHISFRSGDLRRSTPFVVGQVSEDARFLFRKGDRVSKVARADRSVSAFVISSVAGLPLKLRVVAEGQGKEIAPLRENAWRHWQAAGQAAIEYQWHPVSVQMPMSVYFPDWPEPSGR